ncbi:hypothetical protein FPCIR_11864 [Fusarium pseudocircinatum]|uniref:Uncharacterized protein n=1 Tax=Fusarium pseudocircinatum TaxID=56676 RepID=A0A8H5NSU2_9HYPO|nr:hypothetical protein FPCIR_11864 [Fusarium pseudocircinatum]
MTRPKDLPRSTDFKTKSEINKMINLVEKDIETVKQKIKTEEWEAVDQGSLKLGASCIVTSDPTLYPKDQKVMAQQQHNEYKEKEDNATQSKEELHRERKKMERRLEELQNLRDKWRGAD